jgi:hypothetical protein
LKAKAWLPSTKLMHFCYDVFHRFCQLNVIQSWGIRWRWPGGEGGIIDIEEINYKLVSRWVQKQIGIFWTLLLSHAHFNTSTIMPNVCAHRVHVVSIHNHMHNDYMMRTNNNTWNMSIHIFKDCLFVSKLIKNPKWPRYWSKMTLNYWVIVERYPLWMEWLVVQYPLWNLLSTRPNYWK